MTDATEEILMRSIYAEMRRIRVLVPDSRWYLFGSILRAKRPISDIDLLVVCKSAAACKSIRAELALVCATYPIHLLLMTASEETEMKFISGERAFEIKSCEAVPASVQGRTSAAPSAASVEIALA